MRTVWRVVGTVAAVLCSLNAIVLLGTTLWGLVSPESIDVGGPSPWLVLTPWILGFFVLARWALRRAERTPPTVAERRVVDRVQQVDAWTNEHLITGAAAGGVLLGGVWGLLIGWRFALVGGAIGAAARLIARGSRRRRVLG